MDPVSFGKVVLSYNLLPKDWVVTLALVIPYAEFILGLALLLNLYPKTAAYAALGMVAVFTAVAMYRYASGDVSDCGCFGKLLERQNDWKLLLENTAVLFLLGLLIVNKEERKKQ